MDNFKLLTRDNFRNAVFARDNYKCVNCSDCAVDAHHILERRLFPDGGYYLENGASVCSACHILAETTELSADDLRHKIGIKSFPVPPHLYRDQPYDKWGNPILPNGMRMRGELFNDVSVQKIISGVLHLFTSYVKYPRTHHLPWSPGVNSDDRVMSSTSEFETNPVVITLKMDGENTTLYKDHLHARSLNYDPHPSRNMIRSLHASIAHDIPDGWRICGENLYAKHSIQYQNLASHFLVFSIWNENNTCLSWQDTVEYSALLGLKTVPVIYIGEYNEGNVKKIVPKHDNESQCEGYVVRVQREFSYSEFGKCIGKYVRKDHVQTHGGWMRSQVIKNGFEM